MEVDAIPLALQRDRLTLDDTCVLVMGWSGTPSSWVLLFCYTGVCIACFPSGFILDFQMNNSSLAPHIGLLNELLNA